jgi:alpha-D-ribose 1-methylphosphonate 5-triphosphate synthase subunit PhnH
MPVDPFNYHENRDNEQGQEQLLSFHGSPPLVNTLLSKRINIEERGSEVTTLATLFVPGVSSYPGASTRVTTLGAQL